MVLVSMKLLTSPISFNVDIHGIDIGIDSQSLTIPYGFDELSNLIGTNAENNRKILEFATCKKCELIEHVVLNDEETRHPKISIICRDLEQGYYLVVSVQASNNKNECLASYLYLFSQTKKVGRLEQAWHDLTRRASSEDWDVLDQILIDTSMEKMICFDTKYFDEHEELKESDFFREQANYFISDYEGDQLPALMALDRDNCRGLCAILNHHDGFAAHAIVGDNFEETLVDFKSLHEGYEALGIEMTLRHAYIPFEDTLDSILRYAEDGEIDTDILDQLNEFEREKVERIILEREDIILDDEFIRELTTLSPQEIEIIAKRSSQKKS
jgi:hypothetical protein